MKASCIKLRFSTYIVFALCLFATHSAQCDTYLPVSLGTNANARLQDLCPAYPEGAGLTLAGVIFDIPPGGLNYFAADFAAPSTALPVTLTIPVNRAGVRGVHTLINTFWGDIQDGTLAELRFTYTDASVVTVALDGNAHIRDFHQDIYTNTIQGPTTVNVVNLDGDGIVGPGNYRLDKQFFSLQQHVNKTLQSITLVDNGGDHVQRLFLAGISLQIVSGVATTIEPAVIISWDGVAGQTYQMQETVSLETSEWNNLGSPINGINGKMSFADSTTGRPRRFYRVINP
ncbi:MAG: hypothetical protein V4819_23270 [Verrucomicrobiota bacterium]